MNANFSRADFPLNFSPGNFGVTQAIDLIAYTLYEIGDGSRDERAITLQPFLIVCKVYSGKLV